MNSQTDLFQCNYEDCKTDINHGATLDKVLSVHDVSNDLNLSDKLKIEVSAKSMEEKIKIIFAEQRVNLSAEDVLKLLNNPHALLTSTRRSLSNLSSSKFGNYLIKDTHVKKMGSNGVLCVTYKLNQQ